jgi:hypothetical protein
VGNAGRKEALGHFGRYEQQKTVTTIFVIAVAPRDSGTGECGAQSEVKALSHDNLVLVRSPRVSEAFHIYANDGPMYGE